MSVFLSVDHAPRCDVCDKVAVITVKVATSRISVCRKHGFALFMDIEKALNEHSSPDDD